MKDSNIANNQGPGQVNNKRLKKLAKNWGSMPERERQRVMQDLIKGMSDKHAQAIQEYFKRLSNTKK
jgi:hypothetical protein